MYSSYWKPTDGRQSNILTDHEALHRDEATHKSIQSDETKLRPLDLETIMSSKAAVKFWYLHRPKTMEYVHKNATKIQSVGRAFAVRKLKKKYGAEYMAELYRADAEKRERERVAELTAEERAAKEAEDAAYDARVEESRRLRREQIEKERQAEEELRARLAAEAAEREAAERERLAAIAAAEELARQQAEEEARRAREEAERLRQEEEQRRWEEEELRRIEEEERAAAEAALVEKKRQEEEAAAALAAQELLEQQRREAEEEEERLRQEEEAEAERIRLAEIEEWERMQAEEQAQREREELEAAIALEKQRFEEEERKRAEREETKRQLAAAALAAQQQAEEVERARQERLQEEQNERYEQSLSKDVPVVVHNHGAGRVVAYNKENDSYRVRLEHAMGGMEINVNATDVTLDDDRILSPRTKVDTPFGTGEVVGLDPHVGCYAINTEINAPDGEQFLAFVQIKDICVHVEEEEERAIVENPSMPIPDEIVLVSARIVDSRVVNRTGKKFIQYKLEVKTANYGTVYCWKRYSTFRSLCDRLVKEAGVKKKDIPELPKRHIMGNFSLKVMEERAEKLNLFLNAAVKAEHLQWGIRVDDQIAVYKRRVKRSNTNSSSSSTTSSTRSGGFFSRRRN